MPQSTMRVVVLDPGGKPLSGAKIHASVWTEEQDFKIRERDPKEDYLFPKYNGGLVRLKKYIRDLDDCRYFNDLCRLFDKDMVQLFGNNYVEELRGVNQKSNA